MKHLLFGPDAKMHRLIIYWGASALLHQLTATIIWFNAGFDPVARSFNVLLTFFQFIGLTVFFNCVHGSRHIGFSPQQLGSWQGYHATICIAGACSCVAPMRGAILWLALVVLVFCAFSLTAYKAHRFGLFTIILLGFTMFYIATIDSHDYPPVQEATHLILAASMVIAVAVLTCQFSLMRLHLKEKQAEIGTALERIKLLAAHYMLTQLPNRQHMSELLAAEERRHQVQNESLCIALLDIDFFNQVNDAYDHAAGDEVLRGSPSSLSSSFVVPMSLPAGAVKNFSSCFRGPRRRRPNECLRGFSSTFSHSAFQAAPSRSGYLFSRHCEITSGDDHGRRHRAVG